MNRGGRQGATMELERRAQQIKEVVRVSAALRADMLPEAICAQVAQTISTTLGFRAAVVNLVMPGSNHFFIAATAGITDAQRQRLVNAPPPVDHVVSLMNDQFLLSRSYFIGHDHKFLLEDMGSILLVPPTVLTAPRGPDSWHPDDVFLVPLHSGRENRLLGFISLDVPEDGKIPSPETAEVIELLASLASNALDTAILFQERDRERQALEYGLAELLAHLQRMRQRDFSTQAQLRGVALKQVAGALNDVSETLGNVLADVRDAGMVVQQQASAMRNAATGLVDSAQRQAEQIRSVSGVIQNTSEEMRQIVGRAANSRAIAGEAGGISNEGRQAAEQAGAGMNAVREITLQAARRIKRLGESSQEIGNVIQMVSEFASQTHLLALNAAIEAANAGEHGSGFAIVAREIRSLAQSSNDATKQIQARIKGIQNETNQVAITIEHATQQVVELSDLVSHSGSALHAIDSAIQRIADVIAAMHQTADEQARATVTVSLTMNTIAGITGATWESAEQMRAAMDHLAELATILQGKIELFRLSEQLQADNPGAAALSRTPSQAPLAPVAPVGPAAARDNAPSAASFPAASFPSSSFPSASFPATSPSATSPSAMPSSATSFPVAPAHGAPVSAADMAMLATMPMPALQIPSVGVMPTIPQRPPTDDSAATEFTSAESDTMKIAVPMPHTGESANPADPADPADASAPTPLFPVSSSPLTPMRLTTLADAATEPVNSGDTVGVTSVADAAAVEVPAAAADDAAATPSADNTTALAASLASGEHVAASSVESAGGQQEKQENSAEDAMAEETGGAAGNMKTGTPNSGIPDTEL